MSLPESNMGQIHPSCPRFMTEHLKITSGVHSYSRGPPLMVSIDLIPPISLNILTVLQPETLGPWYSFLGSPFTDIKPVFQPEVSPCLHLSSLYPSVVFPMKMIMQNFYNYKKEIKERSIKIKGRSIWEIS